MRQRSVAALINERLPRRSGVQGLSQNNCRAAINSLLLHGMEFEEALRIATERVRKLDPGFVPEIRSGGATIA